MSACPLCPLACTITYDRHTDSRRSLLSDTVLKYVLATTTFPAALQEWVVESYQKSHPTALILNEQLGVSRLPLARQCPKLKREDALALAKSWNPEIAGAILNTTEARSHVIQNLLTFWRFSDADQLRLVNRKLNLLEAQDILYSPEYCDAARDVVARQLGRPRPARSPAHPRYVPRAETFAFRSDHRLLEDLVHAVKYGVPLPPPPLSHAVQSRLLRTSVEELAHKKDAQITPLGSLPTTLLGDATSPVSRKAWETFLYFAGENANPSLGSLLGTSTLLAATS